MSISPWWFEFQRAPRLFSGVPFRASPNRIEIVNRKSKSVRFEGVLDVLSKQNQNVKREKQPKNMGGLQPMGCSKLCTHADNLALGNTDPPEQQAYTTIFRPREVVGPPMEVVARPTLTPRDQTLNYIEKKTSSLVLDGIMLKSSQIILAMARTPGTKARERRGRCCGSPAGYLRGIFATVLPC